MKSLIEATTCRVRTHKPALCSAAQEQLQRARTTSAVDWWVAPKPLNGPCSELARRVVVVLSTDGDFEECHIFM